MPLRYHHRKVDRGPLLAGERQRCSVDGCPNPSSSRGWCQAHYLRWRRTGDVKADIPVGAQRNPPTCTVEGCPTDTYARGWCAKHYKRWRRHGDPLGGRPERQPSVCAVERCANDAESLGWCHGHYQRWLRHGHTDPGTPLDRRRQPETCTVPRCQNPTNTMGLCRTHRNRQRLHGDPLAELPIRVPTGEGWITHGYRGVPVPPRLRHLTNGETKALEHRFVMAQHLGRSLADGRGGAPPQRRSLGQSNREPGTVDDVTSQGPARQRQGAARSGDARALRAAAVTQTAAGAVKARRLLL